MSTQPITPVFSPHTTPYPPQNEKKRKIDPPENELISYKKQKLDPATDTEMGEESNLDLASQTDNKLKFKAGIRKLNLTVIQKHFSSGKIKSTPPPLKDLIEKIIEKANQDKQSKKNPTQIQQFLPTGEQTKWNPKEQNGFHLAAYTITAEGTRNVARAHQQEVSATPDLQWKNNQHLDFFYRDNPREIYAITTDRTYQVLMPYTDYSWPHIFCRQYLNPNRISEFQCKTIFGKEAVVKKTYAIPQRLELLDGRDCIYTTITLPIRENSPLLELGAFKNTKGEKMHQDIGVQVQVSQIRVNRKLGLSDYSHFLHVVSKNFNQEIPLQVQNQFESLDYLKKIEDYPTITKLRNSLIKEIAKCLKDQTLTTCSFCPKYLADYIKEAKPCLTITYASAKCRLTQFPSLNEILLGISSHFPSLITLSYEEIEKKLREIRIKYASHTLSCSLIDCIEGEIRLEGKSYFRINKCFYFLSGDYLSLVHLDFRRNLKDLLLPPGHEGALELEWGGQKAHGNLTDTKLKGSGTNLTIAHLEKTKVAYVRKDGDRYFVEFSMLKGEILENKLIFSYQKQLETLLKSQKTITKLTLLNTLQIEPKLMEEIWAQLTKERNVLRKEKSKYFVSNPLSQEKRLSQVLIQHCDEYFARETEGSYNERYLYDKRNQGILYGPDNGSLVGDRVLPFGIEIFDVVKYTPETTYIYHIKEGFDLHVRDALSQLINAIELIHEAKYATAEKNVLDQWYHLAVNSEEGEYRKKLAKQIKSLGLEAFKNIFLNRKLVFVYAVLDSHDQELSLQRETTLKEAFDSTDFISMAKSSGRANELFKSLQTEKFLDAKGRLTSEFYASTQDRFTKEFDPSFSNGTKIEIYKKLKENESQFRSTIALLEVKRTRKLIKKFNFEFKICQIKRPFGMPNTLQQKGSYSYNGEKYVKKHKTCADGACSIHALIPTHKINSIYTYRPQEDLEGAAIGRKAKEHFLQTLSKNYQKYEELFANCLLEFVSNNEKLYNNYIQSITEEITRIKSLEKRFDKIYLTAINDPICYPNLFPHLKTAHEKYKQMDAETLQTMLQQKRKARFNAFHSVLEKVSPILAKIPDFSKLNKKFNQALKDYDSKSKAALLSNTYWKPYRTTLIEPDYYLSDKELELAAYLFNKKVILFSEDQEPQVLNENGQVTVFIEHEGNDKIGHYSRLEKE